MNTTPFISDSLNKSEIFSGLSGQQLADVIKEGRRISLSPKRLLFYQDDPAISCFLVNKGRLKLTKLNEQGKEVILRYIGAGELTAAIAVLKPLINPARSAVSASHAIPA